MRIGEEAYTSPAGDLIAFALAVGLVIMVSATIRDNSMERRENHPVSGDDLLSARNWEGWDEDNDGLIDAGIFRSSWNDSGIFEFFPISGMIRVEIISRIGNISLFFIDGSPVQGLPPIDQSTVSAHEMPVLIESKNSPIPGILRLSIVEGVGE